MDVNDLIHQLSQYPGDVRVDAMFPDDANAYFVTGTELLELAGGLKVVVIDIQNDTPLRAV